MSPYTLFRWADALMAIWCACAYIYIDRHAPRQFWKGERKPDGVLKMPKGKFISRIGRVIFLVASANSTFAALRYHLPGGQQVVGIFVGLFAVSIGCAWMAHDEWRKRHPASKEI